MSERLAPRPLLNAADPRILTKFCYFLSTGLAGGGVLFHTFVLRPAVKQESSPAADRAVLKARSAWLLAFAGIVLLLVTYPQFAGKVTRATKGMNFSDGLMPSAVIDYLQTPAAKGAWMSSAALAGIQAGIYTLGALLLISLLVPAVRRRVDRGAAIGVVVIAVAALTLMVPLRAVDATFDVIAIHLVTTLHPYAGAFWIGGPVTLSGVALVRGRLNMASASTVWARVWKRFSIMAQVCVVVLLTSGLFQVWEALYSLVLEHFPRLVLVEAGLGLGVLAVMPFLNGSGREEAGQVADPPATGGIVMAMILLFIAIVASFVANARVQSGIEKSAAREL